MSEKQPTGGPSQPSTFKQAARMAGTFANHGGRDQDSPLDLGASDDAPPAYGDLFDQLNLSQPGFNAGAMVTGEPHYFVRAVDRIWLLNK